MAKSSRDLLAEIIVRNHQATGALNEVQVRFEDLGDAADDASARVDDASGSLDDAGDSAGKASQQFNVLEGIWGKLIAFNQLTALFDRFVGPIIDAAYELGHLGATTITAREGFEAMLASVGGTGEELRQLQDAAGGTISQLKLMELSSYSLVGVSDELGEAILNNNERLIEIARAAIKVRPSLGTVEFAYRSLVDSAKRMEKRIADNLGLQLKSSEASERYAKSVGKSVDALTRQEQELAFFNELLRVGGVLIDQVGGNVDAMTDAFARAKASSEDLRMVLGERLAPEMTLLAEKAAELMDFFAFALTGPTAAMEYAEQLRFAQNELNALQEQMSFRPPEFFEPYQKEIEDTRQAMVSFMEMQTAQALAVKDGYQWTGELIDRTQELSAAFLRGEMDGYLYLQLWQEAVETMSFVGTAAEDLQTRIEGLHKDNVTYAHTVENANYWMQQFAETSGMTREEIAAMGIDRADSWMRQFAESLGLTDEQMENLGFSSEETAGKIMSVSNAVQDFISGLSTVSIDEGAALLERAGNQALSSITRSSTLSKAQMLSMWGDFETQLTDAATTIGSMSEVEAQIFVNNMVSGVRNVVDAHEQGARDAQRAWEASVRELKGLIAEGLEPSFTVEGLVPELSVREDEVDEHYRRLAAIAVRGNEELQIHQEDWADTLALIPDDVRAQGVQAIQDWAKEKVLAYDRGLVDPNLLNKDLLKQRILEQVQAKQIMDELIDQIYEEMGGAVALDDLRVAAGLASPLAGSIQKGFAAELDSEAMVNSTISGFVKAAKDRQDALLGAGGAVGDFVNMGLQDRIAAGGGAALQGLIDRMIAEALARQGGALP